MSITPRNQFAANVRTLRKVKKLSQEAFAFDCGFHRTYIGSVERGECNISIDNMGRIAAVLDVPLTTLVGPTLRMVVSK